MIAPAAFTREGWTFELKHDGFRAFARSGYSADLRSRWARSLVEPFPEILDALRGLPAATLDGELLVPDVDGRSDFEALRRRSLLRRPREIARSATATPAVLIVFDVLEAEGRDMRTMSLQSRRDWLWARMPQIDRVHLVQHVPTYGEALFREIARHDQAHCAVFLCYLIN